MLRAIAVAALLLGRVALAQDEEADADAGIAEPPDVSRLPLTPESIRVVMGYHQPKIQACYEEFLAEREKAVSGTLMTAFVISAEGLVKKPRVLKKGTTLRNPKLHDCVVAVLASATFPKPPKGGEQPVEYPFNLKAVE